MKVSLKSFILLVLLIGSIFTTYTIQQINASPTFVTVSTTNTEGVITFSISNNEANTSSVSSFILQINGGGTFKSFNLENGWFGVKTSPTTLAFSTINPLKPGKSMSLQIKTDQLKPTMAWRALDVNNVEIGSGVIGTQTSGGSPQTSGGSPQTSGGSPQTIRGILDSSTFRIIPSTPAIGSHIRVIGFSFSPLTNLDLYIGNDKIGSLSSNDKGNFVTTIVIPNSEQAGSANFILKDQQGNQKSFSTNLKAAQKVGTELNMPLTIIFDPISHRGETKLVSGTATPGTTLTFTISDSKGNSITTLTIQPNKDGSYSFKRTIPIDSEFGKYTITVSDGKSQVSKQFNIVTTHNITVVTVSKRYEPGQTVFVNGTSISNQIAAFVFSDPTGHQIYSKDANVTSNGTVSTSYKLEDSAMKGTYTISVTQGNDALLLYFGVGEDPSPPITARLDKLSYSVTDKPLVSITGSPSSTLNLVIVDPSDKQKFADVISLGPDGQATYSFNLTSYTPGIYSAVVTHADQKIQKQFAVGLAVGSGKIILNTVKDTYLPGDNMIIIGTSNPNTLLQISLTDPNGVLVKTVQTFSDKTGHFSSFDFKIPTIATPGIWKLDGVSGVNHESINVTVKSTKQGITIHLDRPSGIYTRGDIMVASGTDAGNTASVSIKIGNNSTIVDTLPTSSTNRGEYSTSWQIPRSINPGTYSVEASSITGKATISLKIQ